MPRLQAQVNFLLTCDQLKAVTRTTLLHSGARAENSAEHSWHLALMALTLGEYAPPETNLGRVVELLVLHDLVEIYAGDVHFDQSETAKIQQTQRETEAAARLFGQLPPDQRGTFHSAWQEFEARQTPEARFARALDALQPMLLTWGPGGIGSAAHPELTFGRVLALKRSALEEFPALWELAQGTAAQAVAAGIMPE
ncbi:HD domain-containing protein [Deinococcus arenicola]|uniref:HD domain-containing protein n=1 Tax=Deinococcus arenicola TaxID=2994950 RepID=A0ABU4DRN5_9DEIO|nr:HD domain-containing protein [Deinococcus sp. ZS9-10]MDV6375087.1 HD domain-containing protein [Deinococcus sp. ZS9-10]